MHANVCEIKNNVLKQINFYKLINNLLIKVHISNKVLIFFISNFILKD